MGVGVQEISRHTRRYRSKTAKLPGARQRPRRGVSEPVDMSTMETRPHKGPYDSRDALESLDRPHVVGTDAAGCVHHHSPYDARVVVVEPDGSIARVEDLGDRKLATWIAFIDDRRGWANLRYKETYAEILHEAIDG